MYKLGTIVLTPFPFTDLKSTKVRPAIIIGENMEDVSIVFLSSITKIRSSYDILVISSNKNCLKQDSIVKTTKIATVQKSIILGEIGSLEKKYYDKLKSKIGQYLKII